MADRRQLLREAIGRLPLKGDVNIDEATFVLEWCCYFAKVNELPRMQPSRQKKGVAKELQEFVKQATRLTQFIGRMHAEAQNALSPNGERHIEAVHEDLKVMIARALAAIEEAPATEAVPSNHRLAPKQVAEVCAGIFRDLTGKRPTLHFEPIRNERSGPFLRFIEDVFSAMQIGASAEHYAREARSAGDAVGGGSGVTIRRITAQK